MAEFITSIDIAILRFVHDYLHFPFLDFLFSNITVLSNNGEIWIVCGVILLFFKKYRKYGVILLIALLIENTICNFILKPLIARERPFIGNDFFEIIINKPESFSFPSGHTMVSAVAATVLTMANKKFGIFAIPIALLISFSRIYLCVHYPSDVIAGLIFGFAVGFSVVKISEKIISIIKAQKA